MSVTPDSAMAVRLADVIQRHPNCLVVWQNTIGCRFFMNLFFQSGIVECCSSFEMKDYDLDGRVVILIDFDTWIGKDIIETRHLNRIRDSGGCVIHLEAKTCLKK